MTATGLPKTKAEQVADALREDIKTMEPGQQLPSQKDLADRFGFAGQTIQNGLNKLKAEGLVISAGNLGNFVGDGTVPPADVRDDIKEIRSQIQMLSERLEALENRSHSGGA
ncbi:Putative L-lactate dehydrogenase operon regulatory protein [Streptomyces sp. YIM 121038]|uniref:winged helix-turn-helix domain-containing protein n=1 Tax=Streptomyces sp. YIM 121038 TaxID=2136401 RepID=UPI00111058E5|nr:winged helix-turn-helix domain-containing protein [Streptomyces sp. YIM 121038]QCX76680.1 Putative L-lactate dehydrogenase operon regulatory protein [Streptomyces sp. YIM 121038]